MELLGTILFALLWFVLGGIVTTLGFVAIIAYCDHSGLYDDMDAEGLKENTNAVIDIANKLFPKKK